MNLLGCADFEDALLAALAEPLLRRGHNRAVQYAARYGCAPPSSEPFPFAPLRPARNRSNASRVTFET